VCVHVFCQLSTEPANSPGGRLLDRFALAYLYGALYADSLGFILAGIHRKIAFDRETRMLVCELRCLSFRFRASGCFADAYECSPRVTGLA